MSNNYSDENIATMEMIYGEGYLSAGGDGEVAAALAGIPVAGRRVLDLGCGLGGAVITLARDHGAAGVTGADIEDAVLARAGKLVEKHGLGDRVTLERIRPGPLPFADNSFDVVYLAAVTCHVEELVPFFAEVYRVLDHGGAVAGCEWLRRDDNPAYREWDDFLRERGLNFYFADEARLLDSMARANFTDCRVIDRTEAFAELSRAAVQSLRNEHRDELTRLLGEDGYEVRLEWARARSRAYDSGGIGQGHFRGFKTR